MMSLDAAGARTYIADRYGLLLADVQTTALSGGISNDVVLVEIPNDRFVLKQALGRLRVQEPWFSDRERILREAAVLQKLAPHLPAGAVPRILFVDATQYCYAMTAAPADAVMWKSKLLRGDISTGIATAVGHLHGALLNLSWQQPEWAQEFGDQRPFDQLRLEPYYAFTAARHPALREHFTAAQQRCREQPRALVHGDWSPKNMMVSNGEPSVMLIDFEVIHYGDPSFDIAFLWNHLLMKSLLQPALADSYGDAAHQYWKALAGSIPAQADYLAGGALQQLPLLLLARVDGKSPAEYLNTDDLRRRARIFAQRLLLEPPVTIMEVWSRLSA